MPISPLLFRTQFYLQLQLLWIQSWKPLGPASPPICLSSWVIWLFRGRLSSAWNKITPLWKCASWCRRFPEKASIIDEVDLWGWCCRWTKQFQVGREKQTRPSLQPGKHLLHLLSSSTWNGLQISLFWVHLHWHIYCISKKRFSVSKNSLSKGLICKQR